MVTENLCLNCQSPVSDAYCSHCGQSIKTRRLELKHLIFDGLSHFLSTDSRLARTVIDLTRNPGQTCLNYIAGKRAPYISPVRYTMIILTVYLVGFALIGVQIAPNPISPEFLSEKQLAVTQMVFNFLDNYFNFIIFISIPIFASMMKLLFRSSKHNYTEILAMAFFMVSHNQLLTLIISPTELISIRLNFILRVGVVFSFMAWTLFGFFNPKSLLDRLKCVMGLAFFAVSVFIVFAVGVGPKIYLLVQTWK